MGRTLSEQPNAERRSGSPWKSRRWLLAGLAVLLLAAAIPGFVVLGPGDPSPEAAPVEPMDTLGFAADAWADEESTDGVYAAVELNPHVVPEPSGDRPAETAEPGFEAATSAGDSEALDCIIEPAEVIDVRSTVEGRIQQIHVERSDLVEAGQIVAQLDSAVERASVEVARARAAMTGKILTREANVELSTRRRDRSEKLFSGQAVSLDLREEAETEARMAKRELQAAHESQRLAALEHLHAIEVLKRRTIRSPVAGIVMERLMSPGEVVDEDTILRIAQVDPLRVEVVLPAARFGSVQKDMKAAIVPEIPGDQIHVAAVTLVDGVIDGASGTFGARLELPNPDHAIPGGLHCQVRFITE